MPINKKGGKGCKKGKSVAKDDETILMVECNTADGQMFGRVLKAVGDRRFIIFCNDFKERVCKLAGSIRKNDRVESGGIVLISVRDLSFTTTGSLADKNEVGDIISTVDSRLYGKLKKMNGINPLLFANMEGQNSAEVASRIRRMGDTEKGEEEDDDLFDRGGGERERERDNGSGRERDNGSGRERERESGGESDENNDTGLKVYTKEDIAEIEKKKVKEQLERDTKRKNKYEGDISLDDL